MKWTEHEINNLKNLYDKKDINELVLLLNKSKYAISKKANRLKLNKKDYFKNSLKEIKPYKFKKDGFGYFICGFTAGEGCFTESNNKFVFKIALAQNDKEILYKIKTYLKCGTICLMDSRHENWQPEIAYSVQSKKDIIKYIIPFFNKYKLFETRKQEQYNLWKQKLYDSIKLPA